MTVSDSEADKLKDTNKLPAGEIHAQIHRIKQIANGYNQIHTLTALETRWAPAISLLLSQIFIKTINQMK